MSETLPVVIRAAYGITEKDLYEAQKQHAGWSTKIRIALGVFMLPMGALLLVVGHSWQGVVPLALGAFFLFGMRLMMKSTFKRDFANQPETTVTASETGIEYANAKGSSSCQWNAFPRYVETKNLFLLYLQSNIFKVIPKRALTPEDTASLQDLIARNVSNKAPVGNKLKLVVFVVIVLAAAVLVAVAVTNKGQQ